MTLTLSWWVLPLVIALVGFVGGIVHEMMCECWGLLALIWWFCGFGLALGIVVGHFL